MFAPMECKDNSDAYLYFKEREHEIFPIENNYEGTLFICSLFLIILRKAFATLFFHRGSSIQLITIHNIYFIYKI